MYDLKMATKISDSLPSSYEPPCALPRNPIRRILGALTAQSFQHLSYILTGLACSFSSFGMVHADPG